MNKGMWHIGDDAADMIDALEHEVDGGPLRLGIKW